MLVLFLVIFMAGCIGNTNTDLLVCHLDVYHLLEVYHYSVKDPRFPSLLMPIALCLPKSSHPPFEREYLFKRMSYNLQCDWHVLDQHKHCSCGIDRQKLMFTVPLLWWNVWYFLGTFIEKHSWAGIVLLPSSYVEVDANLQYLPGTNSPSLA